MHKVSGTILQRSGGVLE